MSGNAPLVLVVEDEPSLLRALAINLKARHYEVVAAGDGGSALREAARRMPDLVILDLGLPDLDGVEVILGLRPWCTAPILVLSAREDQAQKVAALDAGADDYVTKPFGMEELLARVRAALRRVEAPVGMDPVVRTDAFTIDLASRVVHGVDGVPIRLTPTEWGLLDVLVRNAGRHVPAKTLLQEVWGPAYGTETNYLRVYFAALRRKLEPDPAHPRYLITDPGMGYHFAP